MDRQKQAEIDSRTPEFMAHEATKPFGWYSALFVEWATINEILHRIGLAPGDSVLDVGCGSGWTSLFLAEAGFDVLGVDLVADNVRIARERADRWESSARFAVADMETLDLGERFDAALIFDALHHVRLQAQALKAVGRHVRRGGWLVLGEPTWLHRVSPGAHRARRDLGWRERGLTLPRLRRDLRCAGFPTQRRFFQGTSPYEGWQVGSQALRLFAARLLVAPGHHVWLAAQRADEGQGALR